MVLPYQYFITWYNFSWSLLQISFFRSSLFFFIRSIFFLGSNFFFFLYSICLSSFIILVRNFRNCFSFSDFLILLILGSIFFIIRLLLTFSNFFVLFSLVIINDIFFIFSNSNWTIFSLIFFINICCLYRFSDAFRLYYFRFFILLASFAV